MGTSFIKKINEKLKENGISLNYYYIRFEGKTLKNDQSDTTEIGDLTDIDGDSASLNVVITESFETPPVIEIVSIHYPVINRSECDIYVPSMDATLKFRQQHCRHDVNWTHSIQYINYKYHKMIMDYNIYGKNSHLQYIINNYIQYTPTRNHIQSILLI